MISSELPELLGMSDRILVMHRGRIQAEFDAAQRHAGTRADRRAGSGVTDARRASGLSTARQFGTLIGLLVLSLVLWALTPHFLTVSNLLNVAQQTSINAIVAVGMTFVILSGGIDLSVGSIVALSGVVLGAVLQDGPAGRRWPSPPRSPSAWRCGLVNGALVSWGGLPPFIVTLGMMSIARGAALLFTEGRPVSGFDGRVPLARHRLGRLRSRRRS